VKRKQPEAATSSSSAGPSTASGSSSSSSAAAAARPADDVPSRQSTISSLGPDFGPPQLPLTTQQDDDESDDTDSQATIEYEDDPSPPDASFHITGGVPAFQTFVADDAADAPELYLSARLSQLHVPNWRIGQVAALVFGASPVIVKDLNLLDINEARARADECRAAMIAELQRWIKLGSWKRAPRRPGANILDSRWVLKYKVVNGVKQIKARLTARGYKDKQSSELSTFSPTASRWSQRLLVIVCVQEGWVLVSADVSQAFLRGVSFDELAESEPQLLREVAIDVPPGSVALQRW